MTVWAAIPVKPLSEGKSRLAAALSPAARERLNEFLFRQTLDAVAAVIPAANIMVVSRDLGLLALAVARGARAIEERSEGLNAALAQAASLVPDDALLAISTDLPEITPDDVRAMLGTGLACAIAPDRAQRGTNALFIAPAGGIGFHFGDESFAAHLAAARATGIEPAIVTRFGLAFDLDWPEDLGLCPQVWSVR